MKKILYLIIILNVFPVQNALRAQHITNTLGSFGTFTVRDGSDVFLNLSQYTGNLSLYRCLSMSYCGSSTVGVILKNSERFIHDYRAPGTDGFNTFVGINSGNFTMSGFTNQASSNTALGYQTLNMLTTGFNNAAIGSNSLFSNTSGYSNIAVGSSVLYSNSSGSFNVGVGEQSMLNNTTGSQNVAIGFNSLGSNITGDFNIAIGSPSMVFNTTGYSNTAVGIQSLQYNTTGFNNTAIGINALYNNTTGQNNTSLGYHSGFDITTGSNNIAIGNNAQVPSGTTSNQVRIGNTFITYAGVQVPWSITSDRRWKQNVVASNLGLGFISKLKPVSYTRINDESSKTEYGFIAQDVEEVLKEHHTEESGMVTVDSEGRYELRYNDLLAPMVKAMQELKEENDRLKKEVESIKNIEAKLAELEKVISEMNREKKLKAANK